MRKKLFTVLVLISFAFGSGYARAQQKTSASKAEAEAEAAAREKAYGLLETLAGQLGTMQSAENRARIGSNIAGSLWPHNEARAREVFIAIQQDIPLGELVKVFENAGHSRLVVFNDTLDDPVGMVHIRDLIGFMTARASAGPKPNSRRKKKLPEGALDLGAIDLSMSLSAAKIVRTILFVPPSMPAIDLLAKMQATRIHLALVVDEYGGTDGIVSIEDVVELIVGNIEDEHDDEQAPGILKQSDGSFVADARASLEDVIAAVGKGFDVGEALNNVDTLAGYLVTQVGRVPVRGELVPGPAGFEFEVLDADPRRVKKVRIHRGKNRKSERGRETPAASPAPKAPQALPRDPGTIKPTRQP